jgi:hypothetical protein
VPEQRRGWPLNYIPAGEANWRAFVARATTDQIEEAALRIAYDALLAGNVELAAEALRAVLQDRDRRGVGGPPQ